jgi:hypothetical protein
VDARGTAIAFSRVLDASSESSLQLLLRSLSQEKEPEIKSSQNLDGTFLAG